MYINESPLKSVDWDFATSYSGSGVHTVHPYPAKFIPQIPRQAINLLYPGDSTVILDPFAGSGTTLVEAIDVGIDAYGVDLHPLACLISKVKTTPLRHDFKNVVEDVVGNARLESKRKNVEIPLIPRLNHWFEKPVQEVLAALTDQIRIVEDQDVADALSIALSSIIVQVSNQESDTRYAAIKKNISKNSVFLRFEKAAVKLNDSLIKHFNDTEKNFGKATIINANVLSIKAKDLPTNVGLVITSPPYPNKYEYWLYHKYRMYWLGMDPITVKRSEIGARPHYFKKYHQDERDFEKQMKVCFQLLSKVMIPKGFACFLVGHSIIHGRTINNVDLLVRAAQPYGFTVNDIIERRVPKTRKAFNPLHGKLSREHLIVFALSHPQ